MMNLNSAVSLAAALITAFTFTGVVGGCVSDASCEHTSSERTIEWTCTSPIPWTGLPVTDPGVTDPPATKPAPRHCCEFLDSCSDSQVSGVLAIEKLKHTLEGKEHKSTWYLLQKDEVPTRDIGIWNTYSVEDDTHPVDTYLQHKDGCPAGEPIWPNWPQIVFAYAESSIEVSGLTTDTDTLVPGSLSGISFTCNSETSQCDVATTFDSADKKPLSDEPPIVTQRRCSNNLDDEILDVTASSAYGVALDEEVANMSDIAKHPIAWKNGWMPYRDDPSPYVMVIFKREQFVTGVVTKGLTQNVKLAVNEFTIKYWVTTNYEEHLGSLDPQTFYAGAHGDTKAVNYFPNTLQAFAIKILINDDAAGVGLRFNLLGCPVCQSNADCATDGRCLITGYCSYGEDPFVSEAARDVGERILDTLNVPQVEKDTYQILVGYAPEGTTIADITHQDVSPDVVVAAVAALTSVATGSEASLGNDTFKQKSAAIEVTANMLTVVKDGKTAALSDLNTPAKRQEASELMSGVVGLMDSLLDEDNGEAWDFLVTSTETPGTIGTTESPARMTTAAAGETAAEREEKYERRKDAAKKQAAIKMIADISDMSNIIMSQKEPGEGPLIEINENIELVSSKAISTDLVVDGYQLESLTDSPLGASITVPASSFIQEGVEGKEVIITSVVFNTEGLQGEYNYTTLPGEPTLVSSLLKLDIRVDGSNVSFPVSYELPHRKANVNGKGKPIEKSDCVYHKEEIKDKFVLSTEGLKVNKRCGNRTACESDHMTTFAVVMYLDNIKELGNHLKIQATLSTILGSISVLAISVAVAVFIFLRSLLMSERIIIHVTLMITTGTAMMTFMLGADRNENLIVCKVITIILHFLYTAMFSWMLVEGIHLYRQIITVFESGKSHLWAYFVIGFGIPVIVVGVTTGMKWNDYGKAGICFLQFSDNSLWAFVGPIIPIILVNFVILGRVVQVVVSAAKLDGSGETVIVIKAGVRSSLLLLPILGSTWVFGYIQHLAIPLSYIFVILNSLQGFFMAILHCFVNREVREAMKTRIKQLKESNGMMGQSNMDDSYTKQTNVVGIGSGAPRKNQVSPTPKVD